MDKAEGTIELAKSGLRIKDGELVKCARDGKTVGRHGLDDIKDVRLVAGWDGLALAYLLAGIALAASGSLLMPSGAAALIFLTLGIVLAFLGLMGVRKTLLVIGSVHGEIRYKIRDDAEDASGFAATLRALIADARAPEPSKWGQPE